MNVKGLAPQLRTMDLERAIAFYRKLGFKEVFRVGDFYAGIEVGGDLVHLKLIEELDPGIDFVRQGQHLHLYIIVDDIHAALAEAREAGAMIVEKVTPREWKMNEFVIEDPDGHTLYFGQPRG